jgi:cardiolipin synthase
MIRRLIRWSLAAFFGLQALVVGILTIDGWRKRHLSQGKFPYGAATPVTISDSEVQIYSYGEDLYAAMLHSIQRAKERIVFETFIWKDDPIGRQFKQELTLAAGRGVDVYIIYDSFANLVVPRHFKQFSQSLHVLAYPFFSWPWHPFHIRSYARDHRKILVVDGQTAFVGGYNIGSLYANQWRDTHLRITGPDAWEVENVFMDFWNMHRGRRLPMLPEHGARSWDPHIAIHRNDPQLLIFPIRTAYLEAIDRARHHIYLTHAYFIPDRIILRALLSAARRGVDVRILVPATSNHVLADWLSRGYYTHCLRGGIRLLLYQNAMVHAKTATIDGAWVTVGTANMDRLSLFGNFEVNIEVYAETLAWQMEDIFMKDATNIHELTLQEWEHRPLYEKFAELILLPLRPLL